MTVKQLIKLTALTVGEDEVVALINEEGVNDLQTAKKNYDILLRCYNVIQDELCCEYAPIKLVEKVQTENGKIYLKNLSETPLKIVCVYSENMEKVPYRLINDYISTNLSSVFVEYNYRLKDASENDVSPYANNEIGHYTLAFGMASEYCLAKGRISESEIYQQKYLQAIRGRTAERSCVKIPPRRWIV